MADISNVRYEEIKDITESLEGLSCTYFRPTRTQMKNKSQFLGPVTNSCVPAACIMTRVLY